MTKRVLSLLLILVMLVGMLPVFAQAEETETSVDSGELTVEGTNGFGTLLAEDIAQEQEAMEDQQQAGYTLTDLQITGNTATVTYDSLEEATVVVALYTEDGMQLLTSGKTTVSPEETTATVTIEGTMPEYFLASAYLLDTYDMSPLCPAYDTPMYTKEMQDLLASTAEDYDPDRVLQLEESPETNFAVYAETTKVIEPVEGVNTVASVDEETSTYVIENADENITALQEGDIFAYPYGDNELLIIKVATITVDGTTATITGDEVAIEEVFSYVKLEGENNTENLTVDESDTVEGVAYEGTIEEGSRARSATPIKKTIYHQFKVDLKAEKPIDEFYISGTLKGSFSLKIDFEFEYYITLFRRYIKFTATPTVKASIALMGSFNGKYPLPKIGGDIVPGVYIGLKPKLVFRFSGELSFSSTVTATLGVCYDSKAGVQNLSTKPKVDFDIDVEGSIFWGIDLGPTIDIAGGKIATLNFSLPLGLKITAEIAGTNHEDTEQDAQSIHSCKDCIAMEVAFETKIKLVFKILNSDSLSVGIELAKLEIPIGNMYYSLDSGNFGFGSCPNVKYRLTITVTRSLVPVAGVRVTTSAGDDLGTTNSNGVIIGYFPAGNYQLKTVVDNKTVTKNITVTKADYVKLSAIDTTSTGSPGTSTGSATGKPNILDNITTNDSADMGLVDRGPSVASGSCGTNVSWALHSDGTLIIWGEGKMSDYKLGSAPWYSIRKDITRVVIQKGITNIGDYAFYFCDRFASVTIPDSVTSIGDAAFEICASLTSVTIPDSVTSIGDSAFWSCDSLTSVTIPDSITSIGEYAFYSCDSLTSVTIPDSVTSIGGEAFSDCTSLTSVTIPDSITSIGYSAFYCCTRLTSVTIPDSVTNIGVSAFRYCYSLKDVYYTGTQAQWKAISIGTQNECLTNATIHYNSSGTAKTLSGDAMAVANGVLAGQIGGQMSSADAIYGGEYNTEITDTYTVKTADFSGLVAGKEYVLLSLVSLDAEDPLAGENVLFIDQAVAAEDGTLSFRYVQRVNTELSYVMACGASTKDLKDAVITFPDMIADGETQVISPTVVYDGKTLVEGQDYILAGDVDFTEAGEYTFYVRGIYQYTGLVTCTYLVAGGEVTVTGAVVAGADGDALVELFSGDTLISSVTVSGKTGSYSFEGIETGIYTLRISKNTHVTREYSLTVGAGTVTQDVKIHLIGDVTGDGRVNVGDVSRIYAYSRKSGTLTDYEFLCADVTGDGRVNVGDASRVYGHSKKTSSLW